MAFSTYPPLRDASPTVPDANPASATLIRAVIFDLGGTVIIPFCYLPEMAFDEALKEHVITLPKAVIREPMGKKKQDHMAELLALPEAKAQWQAKYKKAMTPADVIAVYQKYESIQDALLESDAMYVPKAKEALAELKKCGIKIAATTGFHAKTTAKLSKKMALKDHFESIVSADEVLKSTRAAMVGKAMILLGVPLEEQHKVVFVTDSKGDVASVKKDLPGVYVIGVAGFGTHMGVSNHEEANQLLKKDLWAEQVKKACAVLKAAGAVSINHLGELKAALAEYNKKLQHEAAAQNRKHSKL